MTECVIFDSVGFGVRQGTLTMQSLAFLVASEIPQSQSIRRYSTLADLLLFSVYNSSTMYWDKQAVPLFVRV
jgi:hypothetical protein